MAEGRGIEPLSPCGQPRRSKPVQYRSASLPRMVAWGGIEPPRLRRTIALQAIPRPYRSTTPMVGAGGFEPPKSPASEAGAFASLTTPPWSGRWDSNPHCAASQTADSAGWPTSGRTSNGGPRRIRTYTSPSFELGASAYWASGPLAESEGLEPPAVSPVTVFGTARPACSPTLRTLFSCTNGIECYASRDNRLRSERYDSAVSRRARVIGSAAIVTRKGSR